MTNQFDIAIIDLEVVEVLISLNYIKRKDKTYYKCSASNNTILFERVVKHGEDYLYSYSSGYPIPQHISEAILLTKMNILSKKK